MKFVRLLDRRLVAFALLRQDVQQHRLVLFLEELERADEQRNIVPVDRAVVAQAELFEDHARDDETLHAFFDFVREMRERSSGDGLDELARLVVKMGERRAGGDAVQITGDRADIAGDRPFVVVQDDDEFSSSAPWRY